MIFSYLIIWLSQILCFSNPWWRHQMDTSSALLAICAGNSPVPGEFPTQRPVTRSFDVLFDLRLNKRLSKRSCGWWFETPASSLWRHRNAVKYTYFCHKSNIHTWIDHVASSDYDLKHISRCHIMPHMPCNVSDHLSVICVIKVYISPTKATTCDSFYVGYRPPVYIKWDSPGVKEKYLDYLESKLHDLSLFDGTGNIDSHVEKLNAAMRNAAQLFVHYCNDTVCGTI